MAWLSSYYHYFLLQRGGSSVLAGSESQDIQHIDLKTDSSLITITSVILSIPFVLWVDSYKMQILSMVFN